MKKFIRQLSATTLALLLLLSCTNPVEASGYVKYTTSDGTTGDGGEGDGDGDSGDSDGSVEGSTGDADGDTGTDDETGGNSDTESDTTPDTTTPSSPTTSTNFGTVTRSYYLNSSSVDALTVTSSGNGTISYQWYKDGTAISGSTSSSYTPSTSTSGTFTYFCRVTNTLNGTTSTSDTGSVNITILSSTSSDDSSSTVDVPTLSENFSSYISYDNNRPASALTIQINASRIESDSINYTWYKSTSNNTNGGTAISSGTLSPYSNTTVSVTPDTSVNGYYYYYCVVTNIKDGVSNSITSNVVTIAVGNNYNNDHNNNNNYYNGTQITSNGTISVGSNVSLNIDRTSLQSMLSRGRTNLTIYGSNLQSVRLPSTNYSTDAFTVTIVDSWDNLTYSWKINDGSKVSSNLDLVVNRASSLSNVNKGYTNLNYDSSYSQVLQFNQSGSLNTNGTTMLLQIPTTVSDGTVWLYKLSGKSILASTELQATVSGGTLYANMQSCSDWLISANKLIDISSGNVNDYYYNIKTDARVSIAEFQNVVIGGYLNLSAINTSFFNDYRFEGWYYDTAYQYPVTGTHLTNMLITADIINNGIYPKFTYYNTHVPETSFPVPSTTVGYLARLF